MQEPSPDVALEHAREARAGYALTGDPRLLEESRIACMMALGRDDVLIWGNRERDNPTRTAARHLLGRNHVELYRRTNDLAHLESGLRHLLDALEALPEDDPVRGERLQEIAEALLQAVERIKVGEAPRLIAGHLASAEAWLEESVKLAHDDEERAWRLNSLGNALRLRHRHFDDADALHRAITRQEHAAELSRPGRARAAVFGNLGATLSDADRARDAVSAFRRAVAESPESSSDHASHLQNLARALEAAGEESSEVDLTFERAAAAGPGSGNPTAELAFMMERARRAEREDRWEDAAAAYAGAHSQQRRLAKTQVTRSLRERQLTEALHVAAHRAYACARAGDDDGAASALEDGRAWLLADAMALEDVQPDAVRAAGHPQLADELAVALDGVRALDVTDLGSIVQEFGSDQARWQRQRLRSVLDRVHSTPGLRELFAPALSELPRGLAGRPAVYLAHADAGGVAVVVGDGDTTSILLPRASTGEVRERALAMVQAYDLRRADRGTWMRVLDDCCRWAWDAVVAPLLDGLGSSTSGELTVIPCGWLAVFPLHAAWTPDAASPTGRRYAIDRVSFAYAPNLLALARAEEAAARPLLANVLVVAAADETLVDTGLEVDAITRLLPSARTLVDDAVSEERVVAALGRASLAHLACHGESIPLRPLHSALHLGPGEAVTVQDLMAQRLEHARLVVLSACETASIGRDLPDEAVGLPSALMYAGAAGVIASVWAVPDRSTALLMQHFYGRLVEAGERPIDAMRCAQRWLRDVTNGELIDAGLVAPEPRLAGSALWQDAQRYDHPYYWAAFTYTGA